MVVPAGILDSLSGDPTLLTLRRGVPDHEPDARASMSHEQDEVDELDKVEEGDLGLGQFEAVEERVNELGDLEDLEHDDQVQVGDVELQAQEEGNHHDDVDQEA